MLVQHIQIITEHPAPPIIALGRLYMRHVYVMCPVCHSSPEAYFKVQYRRDLDSRLTLWLVHVHWVIDLITSSQKRHIAGEGEMPARSDAWWCRTDHTGVSYYMGRSNALMEFGWDQSVNEGNSVNYDWVVSTRPRLVTACLTQCSKLQ